MPKLFTDRRNEWRWHSKADNGRILADGGQGYRRRADALHGMRLTAFDLLPVLTPAELEDEWRRRSSNQLMALALMGRNALRRRVDERPSAPANALATDRLKRQRP